MEPLALILDRDFRIRHDRIELANYRNEKIVFF